MAPLGPTRNSALFMIFPPKHPYPSLGSGNSGGELPLRVAEVFQRCWTNGRQARGSHGREDRGKPGGDAEMVESVDLLIYRARWVFQVTAATKTASSSTCSQLPSPRTALGTTKGSARMVRARQTGMGCSEGPGLPRRGYSAGKEEYSSPGLVPSTGLSGKPF